MRRVFPAFLVLMLLLLQVALAQAPMFNVEDGAVQATVADSVVWSLDFPAGSGTATTLLETPDVLYAAHGNSVLRLDPLSGQVLWRKQVGGNVTRLDEAPDGVSVVTQLQAGISERLELTADGRSKSPIRFGVDPAVFTWLRNEANVSNVAARLEQDPRNPWLLLRTGQLRSGTEQEQLFEQAVAEAKTFYDLAGIARVLVLEDHLDLAGQALQAAFLDFAQRGYTPELLTDLGLHEAYNFPLQPLQAALRQQDAELTAFWARWLYPLSTPEVPEIQSALAGLGLELPEADEEAEAILLPLATTAAPDVSAVDRFFLRLARGGWQLLLAIILVILALQVTLTVKYWAPQSLALRRARETGGRSSFGARFLAIRFFSTTEKLVLALLYVSGFILLGLIAWGQQAAPLPPALQSGTLVSAEALAELSDLDLHGPRGAFISGYAEQTDGDTEAARSAYLRAGNRADALNNLAALTGDRDLFERALNLDPDQPEALFNLGQTADPSPFHELLELPGPLLSVPTSLDFQFALTGTWQQAISNVFKQPWKTLAHVSFLDLPHWLWLATLGLYVLLGAITVLWLLLPRPRLARNAPRVAAFHVLALLIPGSSLADEAWGLLLLLPWALFALDLTRQLLGQPSLLGVSLVTSAIVLGLLYLLNLGAFLVEFTSHRRRMDALLHSNPEAANAYQLRRLPPA